MKGGGGEAYLPTSIPRRFFILKSLRAEDIPDAESDEGQRVGGYFLGVAGDIGCVPSEEEHECCAECTGCISSIMSI